MGVYMLRFRALSTKNAHFIGAQRYCGTGGQRYPRALEKRALNHTAPHSGHIPASSLGSFEGRNRNGGLQPPSIRPVSQVRAPSLTDHGPTGIVPAIDSRGLLTASGASLVAVVGFDPRRRGRRAWTKHGRAAHIDHGRPTPLSSATNRPCRSTAGRADSLIAVVYRSSGLPARS